MFSKSEIRLYYINCALICDFTQVYSIPSFLTIVVLCELLFCSFRGCSENCGVFCQRWCVFLKGPRLPLWCVLCNQGFWLLSELSVVAEDWM